MPVRVQTAFLSDSAVGRLLATVSLIALTAVMASTPAQARCAAAGTLTTCDTTSPSPWTTTIGSGPSTASGTSVTLQPGAQISAGNANAISLGDNATITLGANSLVTNSAASAGSNGLWSAGKNTIEFNNNGSLTIGAGATVSSLGTSNNAEPINVMGVGNVITNHGTITSKSGAAIWFEDRTTGGSNTVDNFGTITTSLGANANVIGNNSNGNVNFINESGAVVNGSLSFAGGNDSLTLFPNSVITGGFNGGGGTNQLILNGIAGSSDSLAGNITNFQTLIKAGQGTWTLSGAVGNNGGNAALAVEVQAGTLALTGNNTNFRGTVLVDAGGTLEARSQSLPPTVTDNGLVNFTQDLNGTYAGVISGNGSVKKTLGATLTLTGNNTYTGGTTINLGEVVISSEANLGAVSGGLTLDGGALGTTANVTMARTTTLGPGRGTFDVQAGTLTYNGLVTGAGTLTKIGVGTLALTASNTYTGDTILNQGTVQISSDANLGAPAMLEFNGGTLATTATMTSARQATLGPSGGTFDTAAGTTLTFNGAIQGPGTLTKIDTGTLVLAANNTYLGGTAINGSAIQIASDANLGDPSSPLSFNAGTLINTAGLTSNRATRIGAGGATFDTETSDPSNPALIFNMNGVISGSGGLTKTGPGNLTLSGNNSYTGPTTVSNGWLYVDGNQSAATGPVTMQGGTRLAGSGTVGGNVEIQSGAYIAPGSQPFTAATLTINGNLTLDPGSALYFNVVQANVAGGAYNDLVQVNGNLTLGGSFFTLDQGQLPPGGTFGPGVYRIINYTGQLINPTGLTLGGIMPPGSTAPNSATEERPLTEFFVQTSIPGQVNLVNATGLNLTYWDGSIAGQHDDGVIEGGSGQWVAPGSLSTNNWTNAGGSTNAPWDNGTSPSFSDAGFALFAGTAGTVTVIDTQSSCSSTCQVEAQGMQFLTSGYVLTGDPIALVPDPSGTSTIRVGDGTTQAAAMTATVNTVLTGATTLAKTDLGTLVLGAANTYTGGTAINGGTLQISSDANLGAAGTSLSFENGTLATTASITTSRPVSLNLDPSSGVGVGTFQPSASTTLELDGAVSGSGALVMTGAGTLLLTNNETYTGGTTIAAGTLQVGAGGTSGAIAGDVVDNGQLILDRSDDITYGGAVSGTGSAVKAGANTLTLTGNSTFTGGTTISGGTLQLGAGGTSGGIVGNVVDNGALTFNRSDSVTFGGLISGSGAVNQAGPGITVLTANNSYTGPTTVSNGWFYVDGDQTAATGPTTVASGTRLAGNGIVGGNVTMADNSTLGPGFVPLTPATLTINGNLTLSPNTQMLYNLVQANVDGSPLNDLTVVKGNLTLDGVINVVDQGQTLGPGIYRIFDYSGTLTNNGLTIGSFQNAPADPTQTATNTRPLTGFVVQTSIPGQVNLVNPSGLNLTYWDGTAGPKNDGVIQGGNGTWLAPGGASTSNWTDAAGAVNAPWDNSGVLAIFSGIGGHSPALARGLAPYCSASAFSFGCTVTVDDSQGQVTASGIQFATDGYVLTGNPITLVAPSGTPGVSAIRVGDGSSVSFAMTAEIDSIIGGNVNLTKTDLGILILTGANTYTGGTTVTGGVLLISSDANLGVAGTGLTLDGGALATTASIILSRPVTLNAGGGTFMPGNSTTLEVDSAITDGTGPGALTVAGGGVLALAGANTYSGGTTIAQGGTLQLGAGGASGSILGDVVDDGTLAFDRSDTTTFGGVVSGVGALTQIGAGTTVLTAASTYTGGTIISVGALQLGAGGTTGSIAGDVTDNAMLIFNRSDTVTFGGLISGAGQVNQTGAGTTIFTGDNTYTGVTTISAGTLQLGAGGTNGSIAGNVIDAGTIVFNRSDTVTFAGSIVDGASPGALQQIGSGTLILTGFNTYTGVTTVAQGSTLQIGDGGADGTVFGNIVNNGTVILDRSDTIPAAGVVSGTGRTIKEGAGTIIVTGNGTYTGGTTISQGVLQLGNEGGSDFGFPGAVDTTGVTGAVLGDIVDNAVLAFDHSNAVLVNGVISGTGSVVQMGTGTTTLGADESYTGGTTVSTGTLQIGNGGNIGSITGDVTDNAILVFNRSDTYTFSGIVSGTGQLVQAGDGTLILTAANSYSGGTAIEGGVLQISSDTNLGAATGNLHIGGATLAITADITTTRPTVLEQTGGTFDVPGGLTLTHQGQIDGAGGFSLTGGGTMIVSGANTYSGPTNILAGTLRINGDQTAATGLTTAASGATLGGSGIIGGDVVIADGGTLSPGNSPGTIIINGSLTLNPGSLLAYELGAPHVVGGGFNDHTIVGGNLILDGTINVTVPPGGSFTPGIYRVITYAGTLTNNGLAIGTIPSGTYFVQTSVANQVNLINTTGLTLNYWDGATGPKDDGAIQGGNGVWQGGAGNDNWTDVTGGTNAPFTDASFAVFEASGGTVTVDTSLGAINVSGMQFASDGYVVTGGVINLVGSSATPGITIVRVGDGTQSGASYVTTITSVLAGSSALEKLDLGTLILSGANSYTGGTAIDGGVLQISNDANLGDPSGALTLDGGTLATTANLTISRATSIGSGNGAFAPAGGTSLLAATQVTGPGMLFTTGGGTLILADNNSYGGGTTISSGTLQLGNGGTTGSIVGDVIDNGTLAFDRSDVSSFNGIISGTGAVMQIGTGTTILNAANSYTGTTTISAGTLVVGDPNNPGAALSGGGDVTVASGATFGGYGSVIGNVINNGTIVAGNATPGFGSSPAGTFTINGTLTNAGTITLASDPIVGNLLKVNSYVGSNAVMNINTVLGADNSPTDQLVINGGTATGNTSVHINNVGGTGALTAANGIPIVHAINGATTMAGAFSLDGLVVAGPYEYDLFRGSVDASAPDDWFLRSTFVVGQPSPPVTQPLQPNPPPSALPPGVHPIIGPQLASYGVVQPIARQMSTTILGTLHERIGDTLADGDTDASPGPVPSAWGRFFAQQVDNGYQAFAAPSASGQILGAQVGLDVWHGSIFPGQRDIAGVYFAFGNANLSVDGLVTNPEATGYMRLRTGWLHQNAYAVGGYWTHYGADGWYLDAVIQHTLYRGSAQAQFNEFNLVTSLPTNGSSIITSLEGGYPFALDLGPAFILEPQAQLMWQQAKFTLANDGLELIGLGTTSGVTGRLGMRAKWTINDQDGEVWQPYARFNIWRAWGGRAATNFDNSPDLVPLVEQATWGEVAAGLTFKSGDSLSLFAQAGYQFALSNNTTISGFKGSFGPRLTW